MYRKLCRGNDGSKQTASDHDFKGIGCSKIGYFKEVRKKLKELEKLNLKAGSPPQRLEAIFESINDGLSILDRDLNIVFANRVQEAMFPITRWWGRNASRSS